MRARATDTQPEDCSALRGVLGAVFTGEWIGQQRFTTTATIAALHDELRAGPGQRVLNIACGHGGAALRLAQATGCRVVGLDPSPGNVAEARAAAASAGLADRVQFQVGDPSQLPFEPETFDAIASCDAFVSIPDKPRLLAGLRRLLRDGGRLAFTAIVSTDVGRDRCGHSPLIAWPVPTAADYRALVERAGLRILAADDLTPTLVEVSARWQGALLAWEQQLAAELGRVELQALWDSVGQIAAWATKGWLGQVLLVAQRAPSDGH